MTTSADTAPADPHGLPALTRIVRHRATQRTIKRAEQAICRPCLFLRPYFDAEPVAWFAVAVEGLRGVDAETMETLPDPFAGGVPPVVRAAAIEVRALLRDLHLDLRGAGVPVDVESAAQRVLLLQLAILETDWNRPAAWIAHDYQAGLPWVISADGRFLSPDDGVAGQADRDAGVWRRRFREAVLAAEGQNVRLRASYGQGEGRAKPNSGRVEALRLVLASRPDWADLRAGDFDCLPGGRLTPPAAKLQEVRKDLQMPAWYQSEYRADGAARRAIGEDLRTIRLDQGAVGEFWQIPSADNVGKLKA